MEKNVDLNSYEEIVKEQIFYQMIQRGLKDSDEGRIISDEEMRHRIRTW